MPGPGRPRKRPEEDTDSAEVGGTQGVGLRAEDGGTDTEGIIERLDYIAWVLGIIALKLSSSPLEVGAFLEREAKVNPGPNYAIRENGYAAAKECAGKSQDDEIWQEN